MSQTVTLFLCYSPGLTPHQYKYTRNYHAYYSIDEIIEKMSKPVSLNEVFTCLFREANLFSLNFGYIYQWLIKK